jgi:hypothetical protein
MKAKLSFALAILALSLAAQPVPSPEPDQPVAAPDKCASFCAVVLCVPYQTCGLYINSSGQTVCGCHGDSSGV